MIKITDKSLCSGCSACVQVCPCSAISMERDDEGFLYPLVNSEKCINCSLCDKLCSSLASYIKPSEEAPKAFFAINNNREERHQSSSGGVFSLLAREIISRGGSVFGAAFDSSFGVRHIEITNEEEIPLLRTSKYLQSEIGDSFKKAKQLLDEGKYVFFTGTPCQISGLLAFLGKEYSTLFTADIICHGVPSPLVWKKYIEEKEKKAKSKLSSVSFRDKTNGWGNVSLVLSFESGKVYRKSKERNHYMRAFLGNLSLRQSCFSCRHKGINRKSDITLADFWGVENFFPEVDSREGVSLVLAHTTNGKELLSSFGERLTLKETDANKALPHNRAAYLSSKKPKERDIFMKTVKAKSFQKAYRRAFPIISKRNAKRIAKKLILTLKIKK